MKKEMFLGIEREIIELEDEMYGKVKNLIKSNLNDKEAKKKLMSLMNESCSVISHTAQNKDIWVVSIIIDGEIIELRINRQGSDGKSNTQAFYLETVTALTLLDWIEVSEEVSNAREKMLKALSNFVESIDNVASVIDSIRESGMTPETLMTEDICKLISSVEEKISGMDL